jgi:hypothetical protein
MKKMASAVICSMTILMVFAGSVWAGSEGTSTCYGLGTKCATISGTYNSYYGGGSGGNNLTGSNNTYVGQSAGGNTTGGSNNVFIGYLAGKSENGSDMLYIDNCNIGGADCDMPLIKGDFQNRWVEINGKLAMTAVVTPSDTRFKKNIEPLKASLSKVLNLNGVSYEWRAEENPGKGFGKGKNIGLLAQDVEKALPELVYIDSKGYKSLAYDKLVPVLVEAIKEQQAVINKLAERLEKLDRLEAELKELKSR